MHMANAQLIAFYRGQGLDAAGRKIEDIWDFDHAHLEGVHDYIQWLFPSPKPSAYNGQAPLFDAETVAVFAGDADLQQRVLRSFALLLEFYGLELVGDDANLAVTKAANYAERRANWQDAPAGYLNHNLLRLTRIIECLRLCGLRAHSQALVACLTIIQAEQPAQIPAKTLDFWKQAAV
jgi:hypothetical protein